LSLPLLTRETSRELDRRAIDGGVPGSLLMENAGRGTAEAALEILPRTPGRVHVVCGPGNNGGDGFAAARHLANAGLAVRLHLAIPPEAYREGSDAGTNLAIAIAMGLEIEEGFLLDGAALVVDALFGTGLVRTVRQPYLAAIESINVAGAACPVVAIDVPSGLDANTGAVLGRAVKAHLTATMVAPKVGFTRGAAPDHTGQIKVVDIGLPRAILARVAGAAPPAPPGPASDG